jgi:hypothetical protein
LHSCWTARYCCGYARVYLPGLGQDLTINLIASSLEATGAAARGKFIKSVVCKSAEARFALPCHTAEKKYSRVMAY